MSIMTKTGDKGQTGLSSGERLEKSDPRIEALGAVDELNAHMGLLCAQAIGKLLPEEFQGFLEQIQCDLFEIGAELSNLKTEADFGELLNRLEAKAKFLESQLEPLRNFILPGGHVLAAQAHVARTVCRRAERRVSALSPQPKNALPYLNRLSDLLFLLARFVCKVSKTDEVIWKKS